MMSRIRRSLGKRSRETFNLHKEGGGRGYTRTDCLFVWGRGERRDSEKEAERSTEQITL